MPSLSCFALPFGVLAISTKGDDAKKVLLPTSAVNSSKFSMSFKETIFFTYSKSVKFFIVVDPNAVLFDFDFTDTENFSGFGRAQ